MNTDSKIVRIDLHCHSWASDRPTLWLMQRLGCPESFTSPEQVREAAMQRGMDFVTITDHNTIEGVKEIEHYSNVIRAVEITTYFPGNVKAHIICLGITDEQLKEIHEVREDIFEFVKYLNEKNIVHICAHPLHKVNGRTTWEHFEQMLLLFKCHEVLNGSRLRRINWVTEKIITSLTKEHIEQLANKHNIEPVGEEPWIKSITSGSDDHSGLFVGTCYTEVEIDALTKEAVLEGIRNGRTKSCGNSDGCLTLSHQVNSIAFQYFRSKMGPESGELLMILGRIFERNRPLKIRAQYFVTKRLKRIFNYFRKPKGANLNLIEEIREIVRNNTSFKLLFEEGLLTREEYNENVFNLANDVLDQMIVRVIKKPKLLHYFIVFAPVVLSSYMMTMKNLHGERDLIEAGEKWLGVKREPKIAWFTDSFKNMDGVSKTCRVFLEAARKRDKQLYIVTSHEDDMSEYDNVINFEPIQQFPTPGYEKVMISVPSILKMLKRMEDEDIDSIVVSTPGPVGVMGLVCAKLMALPVYGIYHTDLPRIALNVSGDPMFAELALLLTRLFYRYTDCVFSPSRWYLEDIYNLGIPMDQTAILERWVDKSFFSPAQRDENYWNTDAKCKILFVGRISKDKNIDLLVKTYQALAPKYDDFVLHCVGDGPDFNELQRRTTNFERFIMTGAKFGDDLAKAYASSDLFIYPGLLDTFGNVIIEAQASGLPCVVMNEGGPQELIKADETGFVARSNEEFISIVENLVTDHFKRDEMGIKAAAYAAERFDEEKIFSAFWNKITTSETNGRVKNGFYFEHNSNKNNVLALAK